MHSKVKASVHSYTPPNLSLCGAGVAWLLHNVRRASRHCVRSLRGQHSTIGTDTVSMWSLLTSSLADSALRRQLLRAPGSDPALWHCDNDHSSVESVDSALDLFSYDCTSIRAHEKSFLVLQPISTARAQGKFCRWTWTWRIGSHFRWRPLAGPAAATRHHAPEQRIIRAPPSETRAASAPSRTRW